MLSGIVYPKTSRSSSESQKKVNHNSSIYRSYSHHQITDTLPLGSGLPTFIKIKAYESFRALTHSLKKDC